MGFLTKSNVKGLLAWTECQLTRWEGSRLGRGTSQTAMQILQSLLPPTQSTEVSIHHLSSLTRNGLASCDVLDTGCYRKGVAWARQLCASEADPKGAGSWRTTIHVAGLQVGLVCVCVCVCV